MVSVQGEVDAAPRSARSIAYHEQLAAGWDARYARGGFRRRADFFIGSVLPQGPCSGAWIDVGCGSGYFSRILAERGASVLGVDGSAAMIDAARTLSAPLKNRPRFEHGAVEMLASDGAQFDGAICLSVLEYLDDPDSALAAITGRLRPGGRLILSAPNRDGSIRCWQSRLRHLAARFGVRLFPYLDSSRQAWSADALKSMAARHGLRCEVIVGFDPMAPRPLLPLIQPSLLFMRCHKLMPGEAA